MAKMVGVWIYIAPREVDQDVNITLGGTVIFSEEEVRLLGNHVPKLNIRIMDEDTFSDDEVASVSDTFPGPFKRGPNSFQTEVIVPHDDVEDSETGAEEWAELYARVQVARTATAGPGSVYTKPANSQTEAVRFSE